MLSGVLPVVQLPYHDDETIDWQTLRREVDFVFQNGAHGIVAAMVTEVLRLTDAERDELTVRLVEFAGGRGPVVASVGAESSWQAARHARATEQAGAAALMAIPPTNTRASASEVISYYERILAATSVPLVVQDASGYVGTPLPIAAQADLFRRHPERVMFKPEAQPLGQNLSLLREATEGKAAIFEVVAGLPCWIRIDAASPAPCRARKSSGPSAPNGMRWKRATLCVPPPCRDSSRRLYCCNMVSMVSFPSRICCCIAMVFFQSA